MSIGILCDWGERRADNKDVIPSTMGINLQALSKDGCVLQHTFHLGKTHIMRLIE